MPGYDSIISNIGNKTSFCSNLSIGEQGAVLKNMPASIFVCADNSYARDLGNQLNALNKSNIVIDEFNNPFVVSKFQSKTTEQDKIKALYKLIKENAIIISTPKIFFEPFVDLELFKKNI